MTGKIEAYPIISIITVVFNGVKTIEQTILSILNQTYKNIEYIIIDGGSTDGTIDIIKRYEDRIAYWVSEVDRGIYEAMNKGISRSKGDYIQFIGADDFLCEFTSIAKVSKILYTNQDIDILSGTVWTVDEKTKMQKLWKNDVSDEKINEGYLIHHQGMFVKKEIFLKYLFDQKYKIVSDYEFILRTYFDKNIRYKYIPLPIAFYSMEGISSTNNLRILEHIEVMKKFHLDKRFIEKFESEYHNSSAIRLLKYYTKSLSIKLGIWKYIQMRRGWSVHRCNMLKCRWCKNINITGEK